MSDLLKMHNALRDETLRQRVQGAVVRYAHYLSGQDGAPAEAAALARQVLAAPLSQIERFVIEVVGNASVLEKIIIGPDGRTTYAQGVPDQDITYVVETAWPRIAADLAVTES